MRFPVSVKAVVAHAGRVPLCLNERAEWELPGGRLEPGEALRAAVEREVLEELGLAVEGRHAARRVDVRAGRRGRHGRRDRLRGAAARRRDRAALQR